MHEAEVALLDEVEQGKTRRLVLLGDRHHQAEVRLHEGALGIFTLTDQAPHFALLGGRDFLACGVEVDGGGLAGLDLLGETNLIVLRQQRVLTDIGQVQPDEIFFVALHAILRHRLLLANSVTSRCSVGMSTYATANRT